MYQLVALYKENRFFRTAIIFGFLFLILVFVLTPKKSSNTSVAPSAIPGATNTQNRPELKGLSEEKLKQASEYRSLISDRLPLTEEEFSTSADITTTINIYIAPEDPPSTVRFEITGLSYLNKDSTPLSNPNIVAYQESFKKGLALMSEHGLDPKQLIFIYSDISYINETNKTWVDKLGLLK